MKLLLIRDAEMVCYLCVIRSTNHVAYYMAPLGMMMSSCTWPCWRAGSGRGTHILAAVAAPDALAISAVSLSPSLQRDTAVLEVHHPDAPDGKTQVLPFFQTQHARHGLAPYHHHGLTDPLMAGVWTPEER